MNAAGQGRAGDGSGLGAARQSPCGEPSRIARSLRRSALQTRIRPIEELIRTYVSRTGSRGEMGILTSINQRLWNNYVLLKNYLKENTH